LPRGVVCCETGLVVIGEGVCGGAGVAGVEVPTNPGGGPFGTGGGGGLKGAATLGGALFDTKQGSGVGGCHGSFACASDGGPAVTGVGTWEASTLLALTCHSNRASCTKRPMTEAMGGFWRKSACGHGGCTPCWCGAVA